MPDRFVTRKEFETIIGNLKKLIGVGSGGSIVSSFLDLTDTPDTYTDQAGKIVKVNPTETALEFGTGELPAAHHTTHEAGGSDAIKLDDLAAPEDNTKLNATTARHGLFPKLSGNIGAFMRGDGQWSELNWQPAVVHAFLNTPPESPTIGDRYLIGFEPTGSWAGHAGEITEWDGTQWNFSYPAEGDCVASIEDKAIYVCFEMTVAGPAWAMTNASFAQPTAHALTHKRGGSDLILLDELGWPTDNTVLNVSTSAHGLCPKLPGNTTTFLRGDGTWETPTGGSGGGDVQSSEYSVFLTERFYPDWEDSVTIDSWKAWQEPVNGFEGDAPQYPVEYERWIVKDGTGDWAGYDGYIACWIPGLSAWQFEWPPIGAVVYCREDGLFYIQVSDTTAPEWEVFGPSSTRHGLVPKIPDDANKFLNGVGGWTAPLILTTVPGETVRHEAIYQRAVDATETLIKEFTCNESVGDMRLYLSGAADTGQSITVNVFKNDTDLLGTLTFGTSLETKSLDLNTTFETDDVIGVYASSEVDGGAYVIDCKLAYDIKIKAIAGVVLITQILVEHDAFDISVTKN